MVNPTEYLQRSYRSRVSTYWWLARWPYLKFILREGSSVFVAWIVVVTLIGIRALRRGPAGYSEFEEWLRSPLVLALNVVTFFFVVFHAVTWFNLAPKAVAVRMRGKRLPGFALAAPNYAAWIAISAFVAWILLRG
jgi:succinate dehydrogenase subunit C